jgi:hypothetical protein
MSTSSFQEIAKNKFVYICLAIFILVRLFFVFGFKADISDIDLYARYGFEQKYADSLNMNLYEFHERNADEHIKKNPGSVDESSRIIEYPPLAVTWITLPNIFLKLDKNAPVQDAYNTYVSEYSYMYKIFCFVADLACFLFLVFVCGRVYGARQAIVRALVLIIFGIILIHVFYDRLDIILGELIAVSLALLILDRNYLFSFFILSIGINFKLIPLLLIPLWLLGSLPSEYFSDLFDRQKIAGKAIALLQRICMLLLMIAAIAVPYYLVYGDKAYAFLAYHTERGVQIESLYSSLMLFINCFINLNVHVFYSFKADNISTTISDFFLQISTPLVIVSFLLLTAYTFFTFKRNALTLKDERKWNRGQNMAGAHRDIFILLAALFVSVSILFSKVFSPQYLLWIVPLVMLFPFTKENNIVSSLSFASLFAASVVTTAIFPYLYYSDVAIKTGPTPLGTFLLIAKNLLFAFFILVLFIQIRRRKRAKERLK